jgi:hypothetical protein
MSRVSRTISALLQGMASQLFQSAKRSSFAEACCGHLEQSQERLQQLSFGNPDQRRGTRQNAAYPCVSSKRHRGVDKDSRALCEQVASLDKDCFVEGPIGTIPSVTLTSMVRAIAKAVEDG